MKNLVRFSAYFAGSALFVAFAMLLLYYFGYEVIMKENGIVEWCEVLWLLLSSLFLFLAARKSDNYSRVFAVLWLLPLIAAVRELDGISDKLLFHGAWAIPAAIIAGLIFRRISRSYNVLKPELVNFMQTQQAVFLGIGFFVVVIFAQLCGKQVVLKAIFHDDYQREIGRFLEEIMEFLGFIILVIGSIDCYLCPEMSTKKIDAQVTCDEVSDTLAFKCKFEV
jgi:hypothetical protein